MLELKHVRFLPEEMRASHTEVDADGNNSDCDMNVGRILLVNFNKTFRNWFICFTGNN